MHALEKSVPIFTGIITAAIFSTFLSELGSTTLTVSIATILISVSIMGLLLTYAAFKSDREMSKKFTKYLDAEAQEKTLEALKRYRENTYDKLLIEDELKELEKRITEIAEASTRLRRLEENVDSHSSTEVAEKAGEA